MGTLLLLGIGLFLIATAEKGAKPPPEQAAIFDVHGGWSYYKPQLANLLINRLVAMRALPTDQTGLLILTPDPQGLAVGMDDWGAYAALAGLHDQGFDLWVANNFHQPTTQPVPAMFLPPGEKPPSKTFAVLILAASPWPPPPTP